MGVSGGICGLTANQPASRERALQSLADRRAARYHEAAPSEVLRRRRGLAVPGGSDRRRCRRSGGGLRVLSWPFLRPSGVGSRVGTQAKLRRARSLLYRR